MAHPIVKYLEDRGIRQTWLARRIERSPEHTNRVLNETHPATPAFRADCMRALGVTDESLLFHEGSEASQSARTPQTGSDGRAGVAVQRAYDPDQEAAIGIPA